MRRAVAVLLVAGVLLTAAPVRPLGADAVAVSCAKPSKTKKAASKMDYGSGVLGPLGARVRDGDMATADVAIFGDSITVRGCGELKSWLAGIGKTLATDAQGSRPVTTTADAIEEYDVAALPPIIIVAAGTNDIFDPVVFGAQMDRILAHLAGKTVLWIDVQACRTGQTAAVKLADQRNSMAINMQIHERLPANRIVTWAWSFISNPARLAMYLQDGVHPWAGPTGPNGADGTANWRAWIMLKLGPLL